MRSRVKNLSLEQLKALVAGQEGWLQTDRDEARAWVEILEANYVLEGTLVYNSPAHYFRTDSGIHFCLDSSLFHKYQLQVEDRLQCKVECNYSGRYTSCVTTYGYVTEVVAIFPPAGTKHILFESI